MQGGAGYFDRVDDAALQHGAEFADFGVVAVVVGLVFDVVEDHGAFAAGVFHDELQGLFQGAADDVDADLLVVGEFADAVQGALGADQGDAAAGDDALFYGGTGGGQGVFDAGFALFQLNFGGGADFDDGDAAGQLGHPLLELLAVVLGGGVFDLGFDLVDAGLDGFFGAVAFYDGGVVFGGGDAAGAAEVFDGGGVQAAAGFFADDGAAGEDGDVFQHGLAAVAEAGGFDGQDVHNAAQLVDHEGGEGFAVDVFADDDDVFLADLQHLFQSGDEVGDGGDFLVGDDEVGVVDGGFHAVAVGDEVGGDVAAVDLHSFYVFDFVGQAAGFFDGDDAVFADFFHSFGDGFADGVFVGGEGGDLSDALAGFHGLGHRLEFGDDFADGAFDAAFDGHGVGAGGYVFEAFVDDGLGEDDAGGGAVAGGVVGFGGGFFEQLGAHIFKGVGELDFLGDGYAVGADLGRAELFVQDYVAAAGAEGNFYRVGQDVDAGAQRLAGFFGVCQLLRGHCRSPLGGMCSCVGLRWMWGRGPSPVWRGRRIRA